MIKEVTEYLVDIAYAHKFGACSQDDFDEAAEEWIEALDIYPPDDAAVRARLAAQAQSRQSPAARQARWDAMLFERGRAATIAALGPRPDWRSA